MATKSLQNILFTGQQICISVISIDCLDHHFCDCDGLFCPLRHLESASVALLTSLEVQV